MTISHILFSIAGVLLLILFGYHFIWGNAAYAALRPERGSEDDEGDKKFTHGSMAERYSKWAA